jgi:NADH dehydrogenase FAD-containing subunit
MAKGFIRVNEALQSETDPLIFAAGDCASMIDHPLEKAGVFAVRMGMPLAENLRRSVTGKSRCCPTVRSALAGADQHRRPARGRLARRLFMRAATGSGAGRTGSTAASCASSASSW